MWEFYRGKSIFITGGSGFLGTALVYRLITHAPVAHIYVLCRGGHSRLIERWSEWLPEQIVMEMANPSLVTVMEGDILQPEMGLAKQDLDLLKSHVHVIVHSASSISLRKTLKQLSNVIIGATECLANMAVQFDHLECFTYVSTAYSNSHLFYQGDQTSDTEICEMIHPLSHQASSIERDNALEEEWCDVQRTGSSVSFRKHHFPWAYAYAKHLSERLLERIFSSTDKRLLILRPSIIDPSQRFPFRKFAVPTSAPRLIVTSAVALSLSRTGLCASQLEDPDQNSTMDFVPVDVVVDRMLAHIALGTDGPVHAVSGCARVSMGIAWENANNIRRIAWPLRLKWTSHSEDSAGLHPIARFYRIFGTSFKFQEDKTIDLWNRLPIWERSRLCLFTNTDILIHDHANPRQDHIWTCMMKMTKRRSLARFAVKTIYRSLAPSRLREDGQQCSCCASDDNLSRFHNPKQMEEN